MELLRRLQAEGDYAGAAGVYRKLLAENPESAELHSNLGLMLHMAGDDGRALEEFHQALRRNPSLVAANLFAGVCLTRLGRSADAIPYLDRACRLEPAGVAPRLARAQAYIGARRFSSANKDYAEVVVRDPSNAEGWFGMGITYRSMADAALKGSPRSAQAGDYLQRALEALIRAVELDPGSERVHLILG
jgi:tetratricopeptide (TPR) repeat protein